MNIASNLVLVLILIVAAGIIGGLSGALFQTYHYALQIQKAQTLDMLSSKAVESIMAFGEVTNVSGRTVTLAFGEGQNLKVYIKEAAKIFSRAMVDKKITAVEKKFEDIKNGVNLNMPITVSATGRLEAGAAVITQ